jgi:integration host factor subunit beta
MLLKRVGSTAEILKFLFGGRCMNKSEMIEALALKKGLTFKKAEEVINTVFDSMTDALLSGDRIEIRGFGSFVVNEYKAYTGRNPKTGESIAVRPKRLPFFKVGKELKERISG